MREEMKAPNSQQSQSTVDGGVADVLALDEVDDVVVDVVAWSPMRSRFLATRTIRTREDDAGIHLM